MSGALRMDSEDCEKDFVVVWRPPLWRWLPDGSDTEWNPTPPIVVARRNTRWFAHLKADRLRGGPPGWFAEVRVARLAHCSAADLAGMTYQHPDGREMPVLHPEYLIRGERTFDEECEPRP